MGLIDFQVSVAVSRSAAKISSKHTLPVADAIVRANAMKEAPPLATSDAHFKGLANVIYLEGW